MIPGVSIHRFADLHIDHPPAGHNTRAEILFLTHLVHWSPVTTLSRAALLDAYITAAPQRSDWDGINAEKVLRFAQEQLRQIELAMRGAVP